MAHVTVLVPSCDRYRDLWRPFVTLLRRHWPDCPYPVVVGSNHARCEEEGVTALPIGDDITWTKSTRAMVEQIDSPVILMLLDDFFFRSRVDTARVEGLVRDFDRLDGAYLRLVPNPPPDVPLARFPAVGEVAPGAPYRASLQAALWRKEDLLAILRDEENPWQMEVLGSRRSDGMARGFYAVWEPALDYYAGVVSGRWELYGLAVVREQGVPVDLAARPALTPAENFSRSARAFAWRPWYAIPWKTRATLLRWARASGVRKPHPSGY